MKMPRTPTDRQSILDDASAAVNQDRQARHGAPERNFAVIGELWSAYLTRSTGTDTHVSPIDVAAMLALLKIARVAANPQHRDNFVDLAGYAACGGELSATLTDMIEGADGSDL